MEEVTNVQIGKVSVAQGEVTLHAVAIGSCIAVAAHDAVKKIGALAHVMLPGCAPRAKDPQEKTKYAADAIDVMLQKMAELGSRVEDIQVVVAGGANVLGGPDDSICRNNIESTLSLLAEKKLTVAARDLGGTDRRSISIDIRRGIVFCAAGDGPEMQLWRAHEAG